MTLAFWGLFVGCFPRQDAGPMSRIRALIEHYVDCHAPKDPKLSFWDFLVEHYLETSADDDCATHSHDSLPFYHLHSGPTVYFLIPIFPKAPLAHWLNTIKIQPFDARLPLSAPIRALFQPPRRG